MKEALAVWAVSGGLLFVVAHLAALGMYSDGPRFYADATNMARWGSIGLVWPLALIWFVATRAPGYFTAVYGPLFHRKPRPVVVDEVLEAARREVERIAPE